MLRGGLYGREGCLDREIMELKKGKRGYFGNLLVLFFTSETGT